MKGCDRLHYCQICHFLDKNLEVGYDNSNKYNQDIPITIRGFHWGPHWGSLILATRHCERKRPLGLRRRVMQLGGMMKFRYIPRLHRSARLARHFSWTVHWHQQQRKSEKCLSVSQSSSQTWQMDSGGRLPVNPFQTLCIIKGGIRFKVIVSLPFTHWCFMDIVSMETCLHFNLLSALRMQPSSAHTPHESHRIPPPSRTCSHTLQWTA